MFDPYGKNFIINRGVAQLVARDIWDVEAAGSNPVTPTSGRLPHPIRPHFDVGAIFMPEMTNPQSHNIALKNSSQPA